MSTERAEQLRTAEELLFTGTQKTGVAKGLYLGRFVAHGVMPFPEMPADQQQRLDAVLPELRSFLDGHLDPAEIDRHADIPRDVIDGLARLGVLGLAAPAEFGGQGFSQLGYCRGMEEVGR